MEENKNLDWPNLSRYQDENRSVGLTEKGKQRVVFMGDSITEEWSNLYPDYFDTKGYINRGICEFLQEIYHLQIYGWHIKFRNEVIFQ